MIRLGDIEASVTIDGTEAREYPDLEFKGDTSIEKSVYIEAIVGAMFEISCNVHPTYSFAPAIDYLAVRRWIDGVQVGDSTVERIDVAYGNLACSNLAKFTEYSVTEDYFAILSEPFFQFGNIITYDDPLPRTETDSQKKKYSDVGEIQVKVFRMAKKLPEHASRPLVMKTRSFCDFRRTKIHEKAVNERAVTIAKFGGVYEHDDDGDNDECSFYPIGARNRPSPKRGRKPKPKPVIPINTEADNGPIASFTFKYRTRAALQQLGIIEPTPEPVPLEDREPESLTPAEIKEVMTRLKARDKEARDRIKQKAQEANLRLLKLCKRAVDDHSGDDEDVETLEARRPNKERRIEVVDLD